MKRKAMQNYVISIDDAVRRCESRLSMLEARPQPTEPEIVNSGGLIMARTDTGWSLIGTLNPKKSGLTPSVPEAGPQPAPDQWPQWTKNDTEMVWGPLTAQEQEPAPGMTLTAEQVIKLRDLRDRVTKYKDYYSRFAGPQPRIVTMAREVLEVLDQILGEPE
jgi:hypothetical protein